MISLYPAGAILPETLTMRGFALLAMGKRQQALSNFLMARRLAPSYISACKGELQVYYELEKFNLCCVIAKEVMQLDPADYQVRAGYSEILIHLENFDEARREAKVVIEKFPNCVRARHVLGVVEMAAGNYALALQHFDEEHKLSPKSSRPIRSKIKILSACPDPSFRNGPKARDLAIALCKAGSEKDFESLLVLAMAHAECGNFNEAIRCAKKSLNAISTSDTDVKQAIEQMIKDFDKGNPFRLPRIAKKGSEIKTKEKINQSNPLIPVK